MKYFKKQLCRYAAITLILAGIIFTAGLHAGESVISGKVVEGYRLLPVTDISKSIQLNVYRGDYIKFDLPASMNAPILAIPELDINKSLSVNLESAPYFKMKQSGQFAFTLGPAAGTIHVIDYRQANYQETTAKEAAQLITNTQPLVLDVRTPMEYQQGHLKSSLLIPVQSLQSRINEIGDYKNQDILIYCATGNRSTVASKILIDGGFKRIINLRHGIVDWYKKGYPIVK